MSFEIKLNKANSIFYVPQILNKTSLVIFNTTDKKTQILKFDIINKLHIKYFLKKLKSKLWLN